MNKRFIQNNLPYIFIGVCVVLLILILTMPS